MAATVLNSFGDHGFLEGDRISPAVIIISITTTTTTTTIIIFFAHWYFIPRGLEISKV